LTSIVSVALAAGCADREVAKVDPQGPKEQFKDIPVQLNRDIDILFVIDDSGSMKEEQVSLAANFSGFIEVLEDIEGGLPNVHIGVVSTDVGTGTDIPGCVGNGKNGVLQSTRGPQAPAGCEPPQGTYIEDIEAGNGRINNYNGTLAETFSCIAQLGTNGCGFEQPLEAMYRALNNNQNNLGFLREDAYLAVVFVTDEDDCSTQGPAMFDDNDIDTLGPLSSFRCFEFGVVCDPDTNPRALGPRQDCRPRDDSAYMHSISRYVDFLKGLKQDPKNVIVAGIIGDTEPVLVDVDGQGRPALAPSCVSQSGEAAPGVRLKTFLEGFPQRNTVTTICNNDLSDALVLVANLLAEVIGNPCLDGDIVDKDPNEAGIQPECQVSDVRFPNTDYQEEYSMPHCDKANGELPCWRLQENQLSCGATPSNLELIIDRGGAEVPVGTHVYARCLVN
jgi:hypothetical protein